jgi:hypothetical protein
MNSHYLHDFKFIEDYNHSIRFVPNYDFVRKKYQKRITLKRLSRLCSLLIGSYTINTGLETTNTMLTSFMIYSRMRLLLFLRYITIMSRITLHKKVSSETSPNLKRRRIDRTSLTSCLTLLHNLRRTPTRVSHCTII